ncbi:MAG: class I SAM-dependent methyltransferase [Actinomycetota bacterium]
MRLDNPLLVRWEYASEERLIRRNAILRERSQGKNPEDAAFDAVAELKPGRIADIGCGLGELAERFQQELGAHVSAIDVSPRMVELTKARGVETQIGDAEALPLASNDFDCVFAGWVLYHVPNLQQAIAECARILRPDGTLVAASVCSNNVQELWDLIGVSEPREPLSFTRENGEEALKPFFREVERRHLAVEMVFPDTESIRTLVASTIDRAHLAPQVPEISEPFTAVARHVIFVAKGKR